MVVYLDFRSAFDMIWGRGLIYKLVKSGITGNMIKLLDSYFESRKIQVRLDGHFSCEVDILAGTPQGAVCSLLLFNLMLIDVPKSEYIEQYIYANDITVVCTGQNIESVKDKMQSFLNNFILWTEKWGLEINHSKTVMQIFTKK